MSEKTVLVLCTGNSCRSQMAEVILNHDLAGQVRALSAGTRPQAKVADGAIAALKEAGLPTEGLHPKDVDTVMNETHRPGRDGVRQRKRELPGISPARPRHSSSLP